MKLLRLDEEKLEHLYWLFDAKRKKGNLSERCIFKMLCSEFARRTVRQFQAGVISYVDIDQDFEQILKEIGPPIKQVLKDALDAYVCKQESLLNNSTTPVEND